MNDALSMSSYQPPPGVLPMFHANSARFRYWRTKLETFATVQGVRTLLGHVSEDEWRAHYAANEDAFNAVLNELERVDG